MSLPFTPCKHKQCLCINDIIESVALEQAAISHILNAEGEKLQKAISICGITASDLLAVNKSVKDMVEAVTKLEIILHSKLNLCKEHLLLCKTQDDCDCCEEDL